jgi:flagellar biosynthesis/type III secretory pathway M-ring protein FliF/YscJ
MRKPRVRLFPEPPRKNDPEGSSGPEDATAAPPSAEATKPGLPPIPNPKERVARQVEADPEAAVRLIRSWLKED